MANILKPLQDIFTPQFLYPLIKLSFVFLLVLIGSRRIVLFLNPSHKPGEIGRLNVPFRNSGFRRLCQDVNGLFDNLVKKIDGTNRDKTVNRESSVPQRFSGFIPAVDGNGKSKDEDQESLVDGFLIRERRYGKFWRSIPLPSAVDSSKVEARIDHGVVEIRLPRIQDAPVKQIKVE
ncbi:hypothetical protein G9A89_008824 [Geosiphon pyriformis]|nr:hypothetical protein G9A89_008824 [Geosiphon pyriformis]